MKRRGRGGGGVLKSLPLDILDFYTFFFFLENVNKPKWMRRPVGGGYFGIFITSIILRNLQQCSTCQKVCFFKKSVVVLIEPKRRDTQTSLMHLKGRKRNTKTIRHLSFMTDTFQIVWYVWHYCQMKSLFSYIAYITQPRLTKVLYRQMSSSICH